MKSNPPFTLRAPSASTAPESPSSSFHVPPTSWLSGTWHVTHSTLPMWKSKRNVRITYTTLPPLSQTLPEGETDRIDDLVSYQPLNSDKEKQIYGLDKASTETPGAWDWRGKGWLMIASSHWEVIGWGGAVGDGDQSEEWAVTYFAKTLFTPAGIDIYSRRGGLEESTVDSIKASMAGIKDEGFTKLVGEIFVVKHDK